MNKKDDIIRLTLFAINELIDRYQTLADKSIKNENKKHYEQLVKECDEAYLYIKENLN